MRNTAMRRIRTTAAVAAIASLLGVACDDPVLPEQDRSEPQPQFEVGDDRPLAVIGGGRLDAERNGTDDGSSRRDFQTYGMAVEDVDGEGAPDGDLRFIDHSPERRMNNRPLRLRSRSWTTLEPAADDCEDGGITATGTLEVRNTGDRHEFRLDTCDDGEPGRWSDHLKLTVLRADGTVRWSWDGPVTGGNLQVFASAGDDDGSTEPTTGDLEVATATDGSEIDSDGYTVVVDDTLSEAVGVNDTIRFSDLAEGDHAVELTGVASNCAVDGSNPRTVTVAAGDTAGTAFSVSCAAQTTTGDLDVTTATDGSDIDADGYTAVVDGTQSQAVGVNDTVRFADLAEGDHTVELTGVASNCDVSGSNPRTVTVAAGEVASTAFSVSCTAEGGTATMRVTGLGALGTGTAEPGSSRQDFDFEATDAPDGYLDYTDWGVVRADGSAATVTVDPESDPETGITSFTRSEEDPACVTFGGTARLDTGELVDFTVDACDYGSPGESLDLFAIEVPSHGYERRDRLSEGEITLETSS